LSLREKSSVIEEEFISNRQKSQEAIPITRICVTGGPVAGKTTALAELELVLK
jgi:predicted ATPase